MIGLSEMGKVTTVITIGSKLEFCKQKLTKFNFLFNTPSHFMMLCKKRLETLSLLEVLTLNL